MVTTVTFFSISAKSRIFINFSSFVLNVPSCSFITESTNEIWYIHTISFLVDATIVLVLLTFSIKINDKVLLYHIDNKKEIENDNLSVAITQSGTTLATAIILFNSMYGTGGYLSGFVFFLIGQIGLLSMLYIYNKTTSFDNLELIRNNNKSISLVLFSLSIGFSIILGINIFGDSTQGNLSNEIISFLYMFISPILNSANFDNRTKASIKSN
jgi:uncharacterized membrane protein YjfL (UPF0719 family)